MGEQKTIRMKARAKSAAIEQLRSMSTFALLLAIYAGNDVEAFTKWINESDVTDAERMTAEDVTTLIDNMCAFTAFMQDQAFAIEQRRAALIRQIAQTRSDGTYPHDGEDASVVHFVGTAQDAAELMEALNAGDQERAEAIRSRHPQPDKQDDGMSGPYL